MKAVAVLICKLEKYWQEKHLNFPFLLQNQYILTLSSISITGGSLKGYCKSKYYKNKL